MGNEAAGWLTEGPPAFIDVLPVAIYACGADGGLLWFNRRAAELWGRQPRVGDDAERYCGSHRLFLDGREIGHGETPMADALRTGTPVHGAQVGIGRADGSQVCVMVDVDPVKDHQGRVVGAINCFQDITARKAAEAALREQQQRFAATYDHMDIAISEIDADGRRLRVNEAACRIVGRSRDQLIGKSPFDILHPDESRDEIGQHQRLVSGEIDGYTTENRWVRGDGETVWLAVRCTAVRDEDGRFLYSVRVFHDVTAGRRALEALRESEQRLAATYENAAIAISEVDADGRLLRVNETASAITGYSRDELLGLSVFDVTHPDDRPGDRASFEQQAAAEQPAYAVEKRLVRKDGAVIWVNVSSSTVRDADGRFRYGIRVMRDITERKRAEAVLRNSEQQMRELMAAMPAAIYTTDADGQITFFNQAAERMWGRAPELGTDQWCGSWRLYHADGTPMRQDECPMARALKQGTPVRGQEAILERPDRTRVPFVPYPTPIHDASGALIGAVNMLIDISERKRVDELSQRLASIVESSDDAIVSKDLNGTIVTWNEGAARLFGYSAEEVIGKSITILIPQDRLDEEPGIIRRIVRGERIDHYDTIRQRKDGSQINISLTVSPVRNSAGVIIGASKVARDVTERKLAEARAPVVRGPPVRAQPRPRPAVADAMGGGRPALDPERHIRAVPQRWRIAGPARRRDRQPAAGRSPDARHGAARACDQRR
jgi:PAS domain S-box-containing protein